MTHTILTSTLWLSLEIFGTIIFAISGAISAVRREFDVVGVILIACVVGNGGGTIRDLLIGAPVFWLYQWSNIAITMTFGLLTFIFMKYVHLARRFMLYSDAVGLGVYAVVGTQKALIYGYNPFISVIMGLVSSIGGGLIRDTLCNQKPLVLCKEIYALAAVAGAIVYVLLPRAAQDDFYGYMGCALLVFLIRMWAVKYNINMPVISNYAANDSQEK